MRQGKTFGELRDDAHVSRLEFGVSLAAALVIPPAAVVALFTEDPGGILRMIGTIAIAAIVACAVTRSVRVYRAGTPAPLPTSVARVRVRVRPARGFGVAAVALGLALPLGVVATLLAMIEWAWLPIGGALGLGCAAVVAEWGRLEPLDAPWAADPSLATSLLERLCMRADMPVPELVVAPGPANAWTAGGRIHVTARLLKLLDDAELEAVLAHEVAHLARRDAAVMEICSAPSRVMLGFAVSVVPKLLRAAWVITKETANGWGLPLWILAVLAGPPAFVIGWISRLSVLGMSRAREFAADAAAVTLTGRPSALASALLKLEHRREWSPRADLRQAEAYAMLGIVGTGRAGVGRLLSTHPSTARRIERLEETEARIQAGPYSS
jgi:heat shock protein HtpX